MKRTLATLLATAIVLAGCGFGTALRPPPTETQARGHLARVVDLVATGDISTICELASATCDIDLANLDPARIPKQPPIVVGTFVMQPTERSAGGFGLQLCGIDGAGQPYASEMLVFEDASGDLISINTLYWLGVGIARDNVVGPGEVRPGC